jgi:putative membrane protein
MDPSVLKLFSFNWEYWGLQTLAMIATAILLPKLKITSPLGALMTVVALGFVNSKLWDAALFFQIPDKITSQVFMLFLANGVIFWVLVKLLPGIEIQGILTAFIAPIIFTVCSLLIDHYGQQVDWKEVGIWCYQAMLELKQYFLENTPPKVKS